jgi:hypothetical protein
VAIDTEVHLQLDLGANAPIEVVAGVLGDVSLVCGLGGELQRHVTRNRALREVLSRGGRFVGDPEWDYLIGRKSPYWVPPALLAGFVSPTLERDVAVWTAELGLEEDADTLVREVNYRNPLVAVLLLAGGGVTLALLKFLRDWPARRRINQAVADDYEDRVRARKRVRRAATDALVGGDLPLTPDLVDALLTDDTVRALDVLGRADLSLQELPAQARTD